MDKLTTEFANNIPNHIAVIMDGNGRWAKSRSLPRIAGHNKAVDSVKSIIKSSVKYKIKYLTLFAFSTENNLRPADEVSALMFLLQKVLRTEVSKLHKQNIKVQVIGQRDLLSTDILQAIIDAESLTANNDGLVLTVAINYGGRWDIVQAAKSIALNVKSGQLDVADIDESLFASYLSTSSIPDPDFLIRTSGEIRISNFLLWQLAYSEIYITDSLWPDFNEIEFVKALDSYKIRDRRFGKVKESNPNQLTSKINEEEYA